MNTNREENRSASSSRSRVILITLATLAMVGAAMFALVHKNYLSAGSSICIAGLFALSYTDTNWKHTPTWKRVLIILLFIAFLVFIVYQTPYHL